MAETEKQLTKKERRELKKQNKAEAQKRVERNERFKKLGMYGLAAAAVLFIGYYFYSNNVSVPASEKDKPVDAVMANDWVKGNPGGEVVLIEYSDFQCPACGAYMDVVEGLSQAYGDNLAVVYRHFPLKQIHPHAELAAQAAEAAGLQGKFWEMHDKLFENQDSWAEGGSASSTFVGYAEELGLDADKFKKDMKSKEVKALVKADYQSGLALKINSTPSFYLQGEKLENPRSEAEFVALIEAALPATGSADITNE